MNSLQKAKTIFEERFYRWSLADWQREIGENYPLLRLVKEARHVVSMMETLSRENRLQMALALVKRFNISVLARCGDAFTEKDQKFVKIYLDLMGKARWTEASQRPDIALHPEAYLDKMNRKPFRKLIMRYLAPTLGAYYHDWGGGEWAYETAVGSWRVITCIDTGGRHHQLSYDHSIIVSDYDKLLEGTSLLHWLGIGSCQTMWLELKNSDVESTAEALARIIKHFMDAVPKLLEGLSPDP